MKRIVKHPLAVMLVYLDRADWMAVSSGYTDGIAVSSWSAQPASLAVLSGYIQGTAVYAFVSSGVAGDEYVIANIVTTSAGRVDPRCLIVQVQSCQ